MNPVQNTMKNTPMEITYGAREKRRQVIYECRGLISNEECAFSKDLFILIKNVGLQKNLATNVEAYYSNSETESDTDEEIIEDLREINNTKSGNEEIPHDIDNHIKIELTDNTDENGQPYISIDDRYGNPYDFNLEPNQHKLLSLKLNNNKLRNKKIGFTITNSGQKVMDTVLKVVGHKFASTNKNNTKINQINNTYYFPEKKQPLSVQQNNISSIPNVTVSPLVSRNSLPKSKNTAARPAAIQSPTVPRDFLFRGSDNSTRAESSQTPSEVNSVFQVPRQRQIPVRGTPSQMPLQRNLPQQVRTFNNPNQRQEISAPMPMFNPDIRIQNPLSLSNGMFMYNRPVRVQIDRDRFFYTNVPTVGMSNQARVNPYPQERTLAGRTLEENVQQSRVEERTQDIQPVEQPRAPKRAVVSNFNVNTALILEAEEGDFFEKEN